MHPWRRQEAHQHGDELVEADVAVVRARARLRVVLDAHRLQGQGAQGSAAAGFTGHGGCEALRPLLRGQG